MPELRCRRGLYQWSRVAFRALQGSTARIKDFQIYTGVTAFTCSNTAVFEAVMICNPGGQKLFQPVARATQPSQTGRKLFMPKGQLQLSPPVFASDDESQLEKTDSFTPQKCIVLFNNYGRRDTEKPRSDATGCFTVRLLTAW